jgi:hypothetical protein
MCVSGPNFNIGFIFRILLCSYVAYFMYLLIEFAYVTDGRFKTLLDLRQNIIGGATEAYSSVYVVN